MNAAAASVFSFELPAEPYPGLRPFSKEEWPVFFGREPMLDEVIVRIVGQCLFVVHGDSGCGKSSLIRAGVLPRLEQQFARGGTGWVTCATAPGDAPLENLARAIAAITGDGSEERCHELRRLINSGAHGAAALSQYIADRRPEHVCILIDQFEELFAHARHHGRQQASILIGLLNGLHKLGSQRLRVVLTMRSEFLGACAQYEGFAQSVNATQYLLPRMQRADLLRAIQEPATLYDGEIATDLAERLIDEAGGTQDQLPLIQHALMRLYSSRVAQPDGSWRLCTSDYPAGGLRGLLSEHADEIVQGLERVPDARRIVEEMFRALTEMNADHQAVRRPQHLRKLIEIARAEEAPVRRILDAFRVEGASLLRPYGNGPVSLDEPVDISHEALIRCWSAIADEKDGWLTREFEDGITWSSLLVQCESFEKDPGNVLSPATTEERRYWLRGRNAEWAERYGGGWERVQKLMNASIAARDAQAEQETKARRAKIFRWGFAVTSTLMLIALFATFSAIGDRKAAVRAERAAMSAKDQEAEQRQAAEASLALALKVRDKSIEDKKAADALVEKLKEQLAAVRKAAEKSPGDSAVLQSIDRADTAIQQQVDQFNAATQTNARIYVHIGNEGQRAAAKQFAALLETPTRALLQITVPGVELVSFQTRGAFLRCFDSAECKVYGTVLVDRVNRALESPQVTLQDFSRTFTDKNTIRPMHFELYFGPGDIVPRGSRMGPPSKASISISAPPTSLGSAH